MRTFQFSDAKSHKFWNIDVAGDSFTVTYGKVGTAGQSTSKSFATAEKAQAEADKLIREKTGKGYVETTPKAAVSEAEALERTIAANPHDRLAWGVYADYLVEKGAERGEFMQVQLALEDESVKPAERKKLLAREKELLQAHERAWLGPLTAVVLDAEPIAYYTDGKPGKRPPVGVLFSRGWLSRLEFHELTVNQARAYAAAPESRFVSELVVEEITYEDAFEPGPDIPEGLDEEGQPAVHALCRVPHLHSIRKFKLGEGTGDEEYSNCHTSGQLAHHLVKQMPHIEELHILAHRVDANKLFVLPMPNLRVLTLFHSNRYPLEKLAANKSLANLTSLRCHPHAVDFDEEEPAAYIRLAQLRAVCRAPQFTKLTDLCLRLTDFGDAGAKEIVESGILKRLKVLDLQGGNISDEGARLLAACPDFKNLEYINLKSNALTQDGQDAIQKTKVKADFGGQHALAAGGDGELPEYLFEGDIE